MVFEDFTPVCREYAHPRTDPQSRAYAAIPGRTLIEPVIEVHVVQLLGNHGREVKIQSPNIPDRLSWVLTCRGKNRFVNGLHVTDPGHDPTSPEQLLERSIAKESELCFTELEQSRIGAIRAKLSQIPFDLVCYTEGVIPTKERKWKIIVACP